MSYQMSIFDGEQPFKIDKPIRLITLFSGYDSQALALKYLGVPFEHYRTCEWAIPSIQALHDLHFAEDTTDYSDGMSKQELVAELAKLGISADYNKPLSADKINRYGEQKLRTIYNNIKSAHNMVSIVNAKGKDLGVVDTDKYCYIMTYSFPCQDLSNAGLQKGMEKGSGTRSGLLWEVERLLKETAELPQVLLMENVPQVIGKKNIGAFAEWIAFLDSLGYHSKWEVINATDYAVPQNRQRCFMVSVLGDHFYNFPKKIGNTRKLRDLLEDNVPENYYLSEKMKICIVSANSKYKVSNENLKINRSIACSKTTREGCSRADTSDYICPALNEDTQININQDLSDYEVRKLTERECFRLMGVKDEDFDKISPNQSKSKLYHLAGDSIVTTCLMALFGQMLDVDWEEKIREVTK